MPASVSVFDSDRLSRETYAALLSAAGFDATPEDATQSSEVDGVLRSRQPRVVLLGLSLAASVLELLPALPHAWPVVVTARAGDTALQSLALQLGVHRVVTTDQSSSMLVQAITTVGLGGWPLSRAPRLEPTTAAARSTCHTERMRLESLTLRERDVVLLVAEGMTNLEIAQRLAIRESTARNCLTSILGKLELRNRFQLAVYALRRGLVDMPAVTPVLRLSRPKLR